MIYKKLFFLISIITFFLYISFFLLIISGFIDFFFSDFYIDFFEYLSLIIGTIKISLFSLPIPIFIGISTSVYISEYIVNKSLNKKIMRIFELLSSTPTISYGYFTISFFYSYVNFNISNIFILIIINSIFLTTYSIPIIYGVVNSIPKSIRDSSISLGATKKETIVNIIFPEIKKNIVTVISLLFSRIVGEATIALIILDINSNNSFNFFESNNHTITMKIASILMSDQDDDYYIYLLCVTIILIISSSQFVSKKFNFKSNY